MIRALRRRRMRRILEAARRRILDRAILEVAAGRPDAQDAERWLMRPRDCAGRIERLRGIADRLNRHNARLDALEATRRALEARLVRYRR